MINRPLTRGLVTDALTEVGQTAGKSMIMGAESRPTDRGVLQALVDDYATIGAEHLLVAPQDRNVDDWE